MSAPLYSRFRRYADREAARFPKKSKMALAIPKWKRPDTRVYSLSDRASYEAGYWSGSEPAQLLRALEHHYLPLPQVWIELDWFSYNKGTNRIPYDNTPTHPMVVNAGAGRALFDPNNSPVRLGFMIGDAKTFGATKSGTKQMIAVLYYLYPTGKSFVGPVLASWAYGDRMDESYNGDGKFVRMPIAKTDDARVLAALGRSYHGRYVEAHRKELSRLTVLTDIAMIGGSPSTDAGWGELDGTTRLVIAAMTAALSARTAGYGAPQEANRPANGPEAPQDDKGTPEAPRGPEWQRPVEVNLFMRERDRPGESIRATLKHLHTIRKGLHQVGAHYAYRNRSDGRDPRQCYKAMDGAHQFEIIEGTHSQVCLICQQKRWFKEQHERGDAAYGIVPPKTYNVRVG